MKRGPFLLDTGFLVALVNEADPAHARCAAAWKDIQGPFLSTEGILVETAWLLRRNLAAVERAHALVRGVGVMLFAPAPWRYARALALMRKHRDVPMDLVDALLVAISEESGVREVLTVDERGFRAFRDQKGQTFHLMP